MLALFYLLNDVFPNDSGPIYKETVAGRFPVEPFNTASNLIFLFIVIYFGIRVYKSVRQHLFLASVLPVIFISYIGGTIYHATRSAQIWLLLDWVPIMLLCLAGVFYFIFRWQHTLWRRFLAIFLLGSLFFGMRFLRLSTNFSISISYLTMALTLLIPVIGYLIKTHFRNSRFIFYAFASFGLAVTFRVLDQRLDLAFLWMGTHWLWHLLGGVAVFFLIKYIFEDKRKQAVDIS